MYACSVIMKCPKCNYDNSNDAIYCGMCYEPFKKEAVSEKPAPVADAGIKEDKTGSVSLKSDDIPEKKKKSSLPPPIVQIITGAVFTYIIFWTYSYYTSFEASGEPIDSALWGMTYRVLGKWGTIALESFITLFILGVGLIRIFFKDTLGRAVEEWIDRNQNKYD
jgi:hypothetical protein